MSDERDDKPSNMSPGLCATPGRCHYSRLADAMAACHESWRSDSRAIVIVIDPRADVHRAVTARNCTPRHALEILEDECRILRERLAAQSSNASIACGGN